MHIKTICPRCESTYQVDAGLKGKLMRCPNALCRAVFEVTNPAEPPPSTAPPIPTPPRPTPAPGQSGNVGDMVKVLTAEMAAPMAPAAVAPPAGPVPAMFAPVPAPTVKSPQADADKQGQAEPFWDDMFSGAARVTADVAQVASWENAPPVREGATDGYGASASNGTFGLAPLPELHGEHAPSRLRHWLATSAAAAVAAACVGLVAVWLANESKPTDDPELAAKAYKEYAQGHFMDAKTLFNKLRQDFPKSPEIDSYNFLAEFSELRDAIERIQTNVNELVNNGILLNRFLDFHKDSPQMAKKEIQADIKVSVYRLLKEMAGFAKTDKNGVILEEAQGLYANAAKKYGPATDAAEIEKELATAGEEVAKFEDYKRVLADLKAILTSPTIAGLEQAKALVQTRNLANDADAIRFFAEFPEKHRQSIKFDPDYSDDDLGEARPEAAPSMAVITTRVSPAGLDPVPGQRPELTLIDGVLYAVDPATGTFRWIQRVGIDTSVLPMWVPATAACPEIVLVSASDVDSLLALDGRDGSVLWRLALPEPVVGEVVIVEARAFVAARAGSVYEIELAGGRCLGFYQLGQPLAYGGVRQPGTTLVYFAADRGCVYALDVAERRCKAILYTDHPSGALCAAPVAVSLPRGEVLDGGKPGPPGGKLLLCLSDAKHGTQLAAFALPLVDKASSTFIGDRLPGRVVSTYFDGENVILATDAAVVQVVGVRQRDDFDPDLFVLHREQLTTAVAAGDRPQIMYADGLNWWVLVQGRLYHLQANLNNRRGWKIVSSAGGLPNLGSAVHRGQIHLDEHGKPVLFAVTRLGDGRANTVSSVDLEAGALRWQRDIGLALTSPLLVAEGKVLATDHRGAVLVFDPQQQFAVGGQWQVGGRPASQEQDLREFSGSLALVPRPDGRGAVIVATNKQQVKLWNYLDGSVSRLDGPFTLDAAPNGNPVLVGSAILLPLASGRLARIEKGMIETESTWRFELADASAQCHAAPVLGNLLATSDGSRSLTLWRVRDKDLVRVKTAEMKARVISAPGVLKPTDQTAAFRLLVADAARVVTLLEGEELRKVREWTVSGEITAGPFVRDRTVILVVDHRRLVFLDPDKNQLQGGWSFPNDIVGEPALIDGHLIVADESGAITALDPTTQKPVGLGYRLQADVAPAAAPVPWGADRLFVPLTDGTVLLPARTWFRPAPVQD